MKKIISIGVMSFVLGFSATSYAQEKVKEEVKKDAKKVGNKTAEVASKSKSTVIDQKYKDKVGPKGETIYIDRHSKYYYVDKKGHKQYLKEIQLKDKID